MREEWILVASREEARIFQKKGIAPLKLLIDLGNPSAMLRPHDIESDKPGRATDNRMRARHTYSSQESPTERAIRTFYREVVDRLERGAYAHEYDELTLIAEPRLLGIIRELLPDTVRVKVTREIAKDLSYEDALEIQSRL
jgi:protein required for attachment to host cells